jgi:hypothetical protein
MRRALKKPLKGSKAKGSHIGGLTKPKTPKQMAKRFLRWRAKKGG